MSTTWFLGPVDSDMGLELSKPVEVDGGPTDQVAFGIACCETNGNALIQIAGGELGERVITGNVSEEGMRNLIDALEGMQLRLGWTRERRG